MKTFKIAFFALLFMMTGVVSAATMPLMVTEVGTNFTTDTNGTGIIENSGNFSEIISNNFTKAGAVHTFLVSNTSNLIFRLWVEGTTSLTSKIENLVITFNGGNVVSHVDASYNVDFNALLGANTSGTLVVSGDFTRAGYEMTLATPIPAAVWLFGSALMGLFGVSRRKSTAVAA